MRVKRSLLVLLALLVAGGAATGAAAAYYWQRATAVPTWYASSTADREIAIALDSDSGLWSNLLAIADTTPYTDGGQVEIQLTETEVNQLLQAELSQVSADDSLRTITEGIRASLEGDRLQAGIVVNPSDLPIQELPPAAQNTLQQALDSLPLLENQEFYVGVAGHPTVENGQLVLGDDTEFQIGRLRLSLAEAARLAGVNPAQLTQQLNDAIAQSGVSLEDLRIVEGQVILRGTVQ